jgi:phosphate ABC transporter phosphate-binding protein
MLGSTGPRTLGRLSRVGAWLTGVAVLVGTQFVFAPAAFAQGYVPISGAGSTWSFNALDQWRRNVDNLYGLKVNFSPSGSSDGRNQFKNGTVDFAVSEIEYGLNDGGVVDSPPSGRTFGYMPIVAGGTAFMYNLKIGGRQVTDLRLSGDVLAKIFAQQITKWDDAAIKADNPGLALPARKIVPVVRSDGSGTTAQFTRWLAARHADTWDAYCAKAGKTVKPCGFTSFYPLTGGMEAKSGSTGVAGFVAQGSSEGSITYVEYSYAKNANFPVAKVLNDAGYYVEPKAANVAVALLKAGIRSDLTSDLSGVYSDGISGPTRCPATAT